MTEYNLMSPESKVWIYQSNLKFTDEEISEIDTQIQNFVTQWVSHNQALLAYGKLYHNRFIVLMVDESQAGASGCSIDKSVHFVKAMGFHHGVDFMDRMNFAYKLDDEIVSAHRDEFARQFQSKKINKDTLVFNNLVKDKGEFEKAWVVPLKDSWHARMV